MWVQPLQKTYTDMYIYIIYIIYCIGVEMTYEGGGNEIRFDWPPAARTSKNILRGSGARICTGGWPPMWSASKKICAMRSCWFQQPFPFAISPRVMVLTSKRAWISECLGKNRLPKIICVLFMIHTGSVFMSELPHAFLDRPPLWWWFPTECGPQNWLATIKSSPVAVPHTLGSHGWLGTVDDQESIHALTISPCFSPFFSYVFMSSLLFYSHCFLQGNVSGLNSFPSPCFSRFGIMILCWFCLRNYADPKSDVLKP